MLSKPLLLSLVFVQFQYVLCAREISAVSWGPNSIDVVGIVSKFDDENVQSVLWHKYLDLNTSSDWQPKEKFHKLGSTKGYYETDTIINPAMVSWGLGRLDVFDVDIDGDTWHKYATDGAWYPKGKLEHLADKIGGVEFRGNLAATSWGPGRIDVVGLATHYDKELEEDVGEYVHLFWDGSSWHRESPWSSGVSFTGPPAIVSPWDGRFDVFGVDRDGQVQHQYWDGSKYLDKWETLPGPKCDDGPDDGDDDETASKLAECTEPGGFRDHITASTWPGVRLDVWAVGSVDGQLWHLWWDLANQHFHTWELLGCNPSTEDSCDNPVFDAAPEVVHWSKDRIDIVGFEGEFGGPYWHKYGWWNSTESQWHWAPNETGSGWESLGGSFDTGPALTTWGEGNFNVLGIDTDGVLQWQSWSNDTEWFPGPQKWAAIGSTREILPDLVEEMPSVGYKQDM